MADETTNDLAGEFAGFEATPIRIHVRVGRSRCTVGRLTKLVDGDVIELDRSVGEPFELHAGGLVIGDVEPVAEKNGVAVKLVRIAEEDDDDRN